MSERKEFIPLNMTFTGHGYFRLDVTCKSVHEFINMPDSLVFDLKYFFKSSYNEKVNLAFYFTEELKALESNLAPNPYEPKVSTEQSGEYVPLKKVIS